MGEEPTYAALSIHLHCVQKRMVTRGRGYGAVAAGTAAGAAAAVSGRLPPFFSRVLLSAIVCDGT